MGDGTSGCTEVHTQMIVVVIQLHTMSVRVRHPSISVHNGDVKVTTPVVKGEVTFVGTARTEGINNWVTKAEYSRGSMRASEISVIRRECLCI